MKTFIKYVCDCDVRDCMCQPNEGTPIVVNEKGEQLGVLINNEKVMYA